jgi:hypothetical protein
MIGNRFSAAKPEVRKISRQVRLRTSGSKAALVYQPCGMAKVEDVTTLSGDLGCLWEASSP